jgi:hemerythrin-like domain-containing protein
MVDPSAIVYREVAISTIKREHHALAQVIELVRHLTRDYVAGYAQPDFRLLSLALYYLDVFPGDLHHSKEEEYLFPALRRHGSDCDEALDGLTSDHARDRESIAELERLLVFYQAGAPEALTRLVEAIESYAKALREHMHREEALLDAATDRIPDEEWRAIAEAFERTEDPLFGSERRREFAALYHRIMNLLPRKMRRGSSTVETAN